MASLDWFWFLYPYSQELEPSIATSEVYGGLQRLLEQNSFFANTTTLR